MTKEEILSFLIDIHDYYDKLGEYKIESNFHNFFEGIIKSPKDKSKEVLIKFVKYEDRHKYNKFIYFYENFTVFFKEVIIDKNFTKHIWNNYWEYFRSFGSEKSWKIFEIYYYEKLLIDKEYEILFKKLIYEDIYMIHSCKGNKKLFDIINEKGFFECLIEKIKSINWEDFEIANKYEEHFHIAMEYCTIDEKIYDSTYYLITKRSSGSLRRGIIDRLTENIEIKNKYILYENNKNINLISKHFKWDEIVGE